MIRQICGERALSDALEKLPNSLFTGKIRALARAYGFSYPFLLFYASGGAVLASYYGAAVLAGQADEETAAFCAAAGFREVLIPEEAIPAFRDFPAERTEIMRFAGTAEPLSKEEIDAHPSYEAVFDVLREAFPLKFDEWYTDTCHAVRHGVSALYLLDGDAAAECAFAENGIAFLSLIAVKKKARGKGLGLRLVKAVSAEYARENEVFLICRLELTGFYQKVGFLRTGSCFTVLNKRKETGHELLFQC